MKTITIGSFFVLLAVLVGVVYTPAVFADHATASVSIPSGTAVPGCEETDECYIPASVSIDVGGEVTWSNDDSAAHTVTSGTAAEGPDGNFDSSLFMAGTTFSVKFEGYEPGTYPYFCMVHPWMAGDVVVQAAGMEETPKPPATTGQTVVKGASMDGSVMVKVTTSDPKATAIMTVATEFTGKDGKVLSHVNYDITATQKGKNVLNDMGAHQHEGKGSHKTAALATGDPVEIKVTLLGQGLPGEQAKWTGPKGETVMFTVVPEFGTIAMMILAVAIISIVAVTAKSKVIPRL